MLKTADSNSPDWISRLEKSLQQTRGIPESRYFQMATCNDQSLPQVRTLVLRELDNENQFLYAYSDLRTEKIAEIRLRSDCALCWYFAATREQYRITCKAKIITLDSEPERLYACWQSMSDHGKKQYFWGQPKTPLEDKQLLNNAGVSTKPPAHFCLIAFDPSEVDYLALKSSPHQRVLSIKDKKGWISRAVVP